MSASVTQSLILFGLIAVGFIAGRRGILSQESNTALSRFLVNFTLPALVIVSMQQEFSPGLRDQALRILGFSALVYALAFVLAFAATPLYRRADRRELGVHRFAMCFSNVGFMGFPVAAAILGRESLFMVSIYNIPFQVLAFSVGILMIAGRPAAAASRAQRGAAVGGSATQRGTAAAGAGAQSGAAAGGSVAQSGTAAVGAGAQRGAAVGGSATQSGTAAGGSATRRRLDAGWVRMRGVAVSSIKLLNPAVLAAILGFLFFSLSIRLPPVLFQTLELLGDTTTPLAMVLIGVTLANSRTSRVIGSGRLWMTVAYRLLLHPLVVYGLARLLGMQGLNLSVPVLIAAMPVAANTSILANVYGGDSQMASGLVFVSTLCSLVSLPLLVWLLQA